MFSMAPKASPVLLALGLAVGCAGSDPGGLEAPLSFHNRDARGYAVQRSSEDAGGATVEPLPAEWLAPTSAADSPVLLPGLKGSEGGPTAVPLVLEEPGASPVVPTYIATKGRPPTLAESIRSIVREQVAGRQRQEELASIVLALFKNARGEREAALDQITRASGSSYTFEREMIQIAVLRDLGETTKALDLMEQKLKALRVQSNVGIRSLVLASKVRGTGDYDKFPKYEFDKEQPVTLYFEPKNFTCARQGDGKFLTSLEITITILDSDGEERKSWKLSMEHKTKSYLFDMHVCTHDFVLPRIEPGKYTMKVAVRDRGKPDSEPTEEALAFRIKVP